MEPVRPKRVNRSDLPRPELPDHALKRPDAGMAAGVDLDEPHPVTGHEFQHGLQGFLFKMALPHRSSFIRSFPIQKYNMPRQQKTAEKTLTLHRAGRIRRAGSVRLKNTVPFEIATAAGESMKACVVPLNRAGKSRHESAEQSMLPAEGGARSASILLITKQKARHFARRALHFLWRWGGSNPRPQHCERCALPTELHPRGYQDSVYMRKDRSSTV